MVEAHSSLGECGEADLFWAGSVIFVSLATLAPRYEGMLWGSSPHPLPPRSGLALQAAPAGTIVGCIRISVGVNVNVRVEAWMQSGNDISEHAKRRVQRNCTEYSWKVF